jgi:molecular chaperone GrpE
MSSTPNSAPTEPPAPQETSREEVDAALCALMTRIAEAEDRRSTAEDQLRRVLAEVENLRRRTANEAERARAEERARVAAAWLPVLDGLDLALEHAGADPTAIVAGVEAVRAQALNLLAQLGFPRRNEDGAAFDPTRHHAVATQPAGDAEPGTVLRVVRPAYGDADRQLRPAAVVVAAGDQ